MIAETFGGAFTHALIDLSIKAAIALLLAWCITQLLRRASAAARHLVWSLASAGVLLLPFIATLVPDWRFSILPSFNTSPQPAQPATPRAPLPMPQAQRPAKAPSIDVASAPSPDTSAPSAPRRHAPSWPLWIALLWAAGAATVALSWLAGVMLLRSIAKRSTSVDSGAMFDLVRKLAGELRIRRPVRLLLGSETDMPITWGTLRPRLLLPGDAAHWPHDRLRAALLHELAHIRRWDCMTQHVAQIVCAIHWFNPLSWLAARRMRIERERACDDLVLSRGQAATEYAQHLLDIARSLVAPTLSRAVAVAMARPSGLRSRLTAILDNRINRRPLTPRAAAVSLLIAACVLIPLSALRVLAADIPTELEKWASQRGFTIREVRKTTLESPFGGWRKLPFTIDQAEEADVNQCIEIARTMHHTINDKALFDELETRRKLEAILNNRPDFFYAEFLLGLWHLRNGDAETGMALLEASYKHAPAIVVQRYEFADGTPAVGLRLQRITLLCNRVQAGNLDPSLGLLYPEQRTDAAGSIYLPAYRTVWRTDLVSYPEDHDAKYPTLGSFEANAKVAVMPTAVVTPKEDPSGSVAEGHPDAPDEHGFPNRERKRAVLLTTFQALHDRIEAEVNALPRPEPKSVLMHQLALISEAQTKLQLELVQARNTYPPTHPMLVKATRQRDDVASLYEQALKKVIAASEYEEKVQLRDRVQARIEQLETVANTHEPLDELLYKRLFEIEQDYSRRQANLEQTRATYSAKHPLVYTAEEQVRIPKQRLDETRDRIAQFQNSREMRAIPQRLSELERNTGAATQGTEASE